MVEDGMRRQNPEPPGWLAHSVITARRLIVPVAGLAGMFAVAYQGSSVPITRFDQFGPEEWYRNPGHWLTWGHVVLPGMFFVLNLTNRRYGPALTLGAVAASWALAGGVLVWALSTYGTGPVQAEIGALPAAATFAGALFAAQVVNIYVFERVRGVPWWRSPLYAALLGGAAFVVFSRWPAMMQNAEPWANRIMIELAIHIVWAFIMLPVYHLLRKPVRPLPGLGGA